MSKSHSLPLPGLDGANPLGFLAALGTWRIADKIYPGTTLHWEPHAGRWMPVICTPESVDEQSLVSQICSRLAEMRQHHAFTFSTNLKLSPEAFEQEAKAAVDGWLEGTDRLSAIFFASFGSSASTNDQGDVEDTAFRTMSGAGHQHFLKTMNDLAMVTTEEQIRKSLFQAWTYPEEKIGLRWDPAEDKRYALAWKTPSQDPTRTQRGANRLAIEALPLFPTCPVGPHLKTTGFTGHRSNDTYWTWPIWEPPICLDTGRSTIALRDIQPGSSTPVPARLRARGIVAVFRSQRITTGKFRNFTPGVEVC